MTMDCYCDYEPADFYTSKVRTARKRHKCSECAGHILPGERYEIVHAKWEGEIDTFKTCGQCVDIRTWTQNNIPCLCWAHSNLIADCIEAVEAARDRAPKETIGLRFGLLRRIAKRDKFNRARCGQAKNAEAI